jgi:hypothetical protein
MIPIRKRMATNATIVEWFFKGFALEPVIAFYFNGRSHKGASALSEPTSRSSSIQDIIMNLAREKPHSTVRELHVIAKASQQDLSDEEFVQGVVQLAAEGKIELEESVPPNVSFSKFLTTWYLNSWLYVVVALATITSTAVYAMPQTYPFVAIRWVAGSVFVLFLPGYVTLKALFPKRELDSVENFALSLGLSLALVPLIGLLLNYTPWGITLNALIVSLTLYVVAVGFAAAMRSFQLLQMSAELV